MVMATAPGGGGTVASAGKAGFHPVTAEVAALA
jgi:hypothetical protein